MTSAPFHSWTLMEYRTLSSNYTSEPFEKHTIFSTFDLHLRSCLFSGVENGSGRRGCRKASPSRLLSNWRNWCRRWESSKMHSIYAWSGIQADPIPNSILNTFIGSWLPKLWCGVLWSRSCVWCPCMVSLSSYSFVHGLQGSAGKKSWKMLSFSLPDLTGIMAGWGLDEKILLSQYIYMRNRFFRLLCHV